MTDLSPEEQRRDDGSEIFKQWCGNSYEWDALTNLERERWRRLALSHAREKEALLDALQEALLDALQFAEGDRQKKAT